MKKILKSALLVVLALAVSGIFASCGMKTFEGDLRVRYDYDLKDYLKPGKYKELEVYVGNTDVTEEELENMVNRNRVFGCDWTDIDDRPAEEGDIVALAYQGFTLEEGVDKKDRVISAMSKGFKNGEPYPLEELEGSSMVLAMVLGCDEIIPGLDDQLIGNISVGEQKTFKVTVPEPSWMYPEYAGQEIEIEVVCAYIQEIDYQEYNDEYTSQNGYGSTANYEMSINNSLIKNRQTQVENYVNTRVWMQINDNFTVKKYPEKELAEVRESLLKMIQEKADKEEMTLEEYVKDEYAQTMDEFNEDLDEQAKIVCKDEMIVYYIARNEQIALLDLDYEEKALALAEEDQFSDLETYITYCAYSFGLLDTDEEVTEELRQKAENMLKEQILFGMVDDFVYENTVQK